MEEKCFCHFGGFAVKDEQARAEIAAIKNRRFLIIGDSYTVGSNLPAGAKTWAKNFSEYLGLTNEECYVFGKGGASFGADPNSEYSFKTVLQTAVSGLTDKELKNITDLIVFGGANEWSKTGAEINSGMAAFNELCNQKFTKINKWLISAGWSFNTEYRKGLKMAYYYYSRYAAKYGFKIYNDLFKCLQNKNRMEDDEVHPNAAGHEQLGIATANVLRGGFDPETPLEHNVTLNGVIIGKATLNGYAVDVNLYSKTVSINSTSITGEFTEICDIASDIILGADPATVEGTVTATTILNGASAAPIQTTLVLRIVKTGTKTTKLYAKSVKVENGKFVTYQDVTGIAFSDFHYSIPIWHA